MTHPGSESLMRYAVDDVDQTGDLATHLAECASCADEVARLRAVAALLRSSYRAPHELTAACLDDRSIAALATGESAPAERKTSLAHVAMCAVCRQRLAAASRVLADPEIARAIAAAEGRVARRPVAWRVFGPLGAVAAAILLFIIVDSPIRSGGSPHRSTDGAMPAPPRVVAPVGVVAIPHRLEWGRVSGADRYRVMMFDAAGRVMLETELADTVVVLPDSVRLVPGERYIWKVEARVGWDRWTGGDLTEFRVGPASRP